MLINKPGASRAMRVRFFPQFNDDLEKIGEVKYDPFRKENQYTALDAEGIRIKDCESYFIAVSLVQKDAEEKEKS